LKCIKKGILTYEHIIKKVEEKLSLKEETINKQTVDTGEKR